MYNRQDYFYKEICMNYLEKAKELMPKLHEKIYKPIALVEAIPDDNALHGVKIVNGGYVEDLYDTELQNGDIFTLDFGTHIVGYLTLKIIPIGHQQDSPLRLRLMFGEMPCEVMDFEYTGALSSTWIQDEIINIDTVAVPFTLPRRYAFRYLKIELLGRCTAYKVKFKDISCKAVTASDTSNVTKLDNIDPMLAKIDEVSIRTLQNCSQEVFEDGPKRDRRLWLGDLRLQAIADFETFKNYDLVKRCLYLFAGLPHPDGQISSCIFHEPTLNNDSWILNDYSLFFISVLHDYYNQTKELDFLKELWDTAFRQAEIVASQIDDKGIVMHGSSKYFIDWCEGLDKNTCAQAVVIYTFKQALTLAKVLDDKDRIEFLEEKIKLLTDSAIKQLYNPEIGFFESGEDKQLSWHSQIWMILAGVFNKDESTSLLRRLMDADIEVRPRSPYMYHHFIQALFDCALKDEAIKYLKFYWGKMCELDADCFWEVFDPNNLYLSPYYSHQINSYCHAWSCTPTYFIRKYLV